MVAACFCFVFLVWAYGHNAGMAASLRRCGRLLDAARALVHLLCQLSRTIAPTVTDYRANCHGLSCQLSQIIWKNRTPPQLAFWVSMADRTFSISQMSRAKLAWTLPWREKVDAGSNTTRPNLGWFWFNGYSISTKLQRRMLCHWRLDGNGAGSLALTQRITLTHIATDDGID